MFAGGATVCEAHSTLPYHGILNFANRQICERTYKQEFTVAFASSREKITEIFLMDKNKGFCFIDFALFPCEIYEYLRIDDF